MAIYHPKAPQSGKKRKFKNVPITVDGHRFDSRAEARRYGELTFLLKGGKIKDLVLQPVFSLKCNDIPICKYIADFKYHDILSGNLIVEDVKSPATKTPIYRLKKKLAAAQTPPIFITEIISGAKS